MTSRIAALWSEANTKYMASQRRASDVAGGFGAASKVLRMMLQSGVLAVGAYLVIYQQATAGIIIAGSILSARALAPVDLAIANWRGFVAARQSWKRLTELLALLPSLPAPMALQPPSQQPRRRGRRRRAARQREGRRAGRQPFAAGRQRPRHHRAERLGKDLAGAAAGRRLAAGARPHPPRRRGARSMVAGSARPAHRLPAAGRRTARRHGGAEHRPLSEPHATPRP